MREPNTSNKLESEVSGSAEGQRAQQPEQVAAVPQPAGSGASLPTLRDREPAVPFLQQLALPQA